MFINAELALLDSNEPDMQLHRAINKKYSPDNPLGSFVQMGFVAAKMFTDTVLKLPEDKLTKEGINDAILNIKNYKTDILCKPWYFQKMKLHVPNNTDRTVTPKDGKMVEAEGCTDIPDSYPANMGATLMHEQVFVLDPEALQNYGHAWGDCYRDEEERVADAIAKLQRLTRGGIRSIMHPTVLGLGRYIPRIQKINAVVPDLHIIVATGLYAFSELPTFLAYRSDDAITELFVRDIREGIDDTGVLHPTKIVIAHAGDSNDLGYLRELADTGASLGCDRFGLEIFNPDASRLTTLAALAERGVTQEQIDQTLIGNPRRFFS